MRKYVNLRPVGAYNMSENIIHQVLRYSSKPIKIGNIADSRTAIHEIKDLEKQVAYLNSTSSGIEFNSTSNELTATLDTNAKTVRTQIPVKINSTIVIDRTFYVGYASTFTVPFTVNVSNINGGTFYKYNRSDIDSTNKMTIYLSQVDTLEAFFPYIVKPSSSTITVNGPVVIQQINNAQYDYPFDDYWNVISVYSYKEWIKNGANSDELGFAFGFAGTTEGGTITIGTFGHAASGNFIYPYRCYFLSRLSLDQITLIKQHRINVVVE